ncbi:hypothetical protein ES703_118683 [subsurface metagenome]
MLVCQNSCRSKKRYLVSTAYGFKGGPERKLSLSEAHITTKQPVHRPGKLHVTLDFFSGARLIRCILVDERFFEFDLKLVIGTISKAGGSGAAGIELCQLVHHFFSGTTGTTFNAVPAMRVQ